MTSLDSALADRREAVVRADMQHENDLDFDASTMLTQLGLA
jgi:hypothetical protein